MIPIGPATAQVIVLDLDARAWIRRDNRTIVEDRDPFWPEVSSQFSLQTPAPMNPANRPGRVFGEIALLLGAVGALIFVIWAFLPGGAP
jgi:hypothetical protein